jgi:hypothetical protein
MMAMGTSNNVSTHKAGRDSSGDFLRTTAYREKLKASAMAIQGNLVAPEIVKSPP